MTWLLPSLGYVALVGVLGLTAKIAMREVSWQEVFVWTAVAYAIVAIIFVAGGTSLRPRVDLSGWMTYVSALIPPVGLALLFLGLNQGEASRVIPVTSVYPVVTAVLAVVILSERMSLSGSLGVVAVIIGVILLSL